MVKVKYTVIGFRQFKTTTLASTTKLFYILDLSLLPSLHTELIETLFAQAHDAIPMPTLSIELRNGFLLMAL